MTSANAATLGGVATVRGSNAARRETTRAELLRLGIARFPLKGYSRTSVEDIVADSGLTKGAFYHYFPDKETFFVEVMRARREDRPEWWAVARDPELATLEAAMVAAIGRLATTETNTAGIPWPVVIGDFWGQVRSREDHAAALGSLYDGFLDELSHLVEELRTRGLARIDLDSRSLAAQLLAVGEGYAVHAAVYGADRAGLLDAAVRILRP